MAAALEPLNPESPQMLLVRAATRALAEHWMSRSPDLAKKEIIFCDTCSRAFDINCGALLSVTVGRETNAAGSMSDVVECLDLCETCAAKELPRLVDALSMSSRREWVAVARKKEARG